MAQKTAVVLGHPDPGPSYCRALAEAYESGARRGGREARRIDIAALDIEFLRHAEDFRSGQPSEGIRGAQETIAWAEHLVVLYPLWHGTMPALLKAFFEQCFRPGFALDYGTGNGWPRPLLAGRSARVVITMAMPALAYRWYYGAHSLKSLERNVLSYSGIKPVRETLIGYVHRLPETKRRRWLARLEELGTKGA
ncbi:MAG: NAD(P)H-dependent oxidoreductase [Alphaproteobacteria bacterium]|nr:NAD(P)H-dependent oxidoreductase [Alphaproteobacteria bacterium]